MMSHDVSIGSVEEADRLTARVLSSARHAQRWMALQSDDPIETLRSMRFEDVGRHPLDDRPVSMGDQVRATWIYAVAIAATRTLLSLHPQADGFRLRGEPAVGVTVESRRSSLVKAETFVSGNPMNNARIKTSKNFLSGSNAFEYVFFHSPLFRVTARQPQFERGRVQVWSVDV